MTFRLARITLAYAAGIALICLVVFVAVPSSWQIVFLKDWNAYLILAVFAVFIGLLLWRVQRPEITRASLGAALLVIAVYAFSGFREPFEFKVLQDEAALSVAALSLHLNRTNEVPYRAHQVGGNFKLGSGYIDKRATFYPLMLSLVHDITGYRVENAFYLNSLVYLLLLAAMFYLVSILFPVGGGGIGFNPASIAALLSVSTVPVMSLNAAGGGFELLNALFVVLILIAAIRYARQSDPPNLWILLLATFLLINLRYESIVFLGFSVLTLMLIESRGTQRTPLFPIFLFSLLLIPAFFQLNIILDQPKWYEVDTSGTEPFSLVNLSEHIGAGINFMFSTTRQLSNNPVFYLVGIFSLVGVLVFLFRHKTRQNQPEVWVFILWAVAVLAQFLIVLAFHDGNLSQPSTSRYVIPFTLLLAVSIGLLYQFTRHLKYVGYTFIALFLIGFYSFYLPATARQQFNTNFSNRQTTWVNHVLAQRNTFNPLIITEEPWLLMLQGQSVTQISIVNQHVDALAYHLRYKSFEEFYVLQNVTLDPKTNHAVYDPGDVLDERIKVREVARLSSGPYTFSVLSRITAISEMEKIAEESSLEKTSANTATTLNNSSSGQRFQLDKTAVLLWHLTIP